MSWKKTEWFWKSGLAAISLVLTICVSGCSDTFPEETLVDENVIEVSEKRKSEEEASEQWEKGYNLPVEEQEKKEAEKDCKKIMELYFSIYEDADKGTASNIALNDKTVLEIQKKVMETGCPVATLVTYSNMVNYESVDNFLKK